MEDEVARSDWLIRFLLPLGEVACC